VKKNKIIRELLRRIPVFMTLLYFLNNALKATNILPLPRSDEPLSCASKIKKKFNFKGIKSKYLKPIFPKYDI